MKFITHDSETYKKIEELVLQKYFPTFKHDYTLFEQNLIKTEPALKEKEMDFQKLIEKTKD